MAKYINIGYEVDEYKILKLCIGLLRNGYLNLCWGYGEISVQEILKNQSNTGTALIAGKTGFAEINKTLVDCGVPALRGQLAFSALGHETEATPRQLISAYLKLLKNPKFAQRLPSR